MFGIGIAPRQHSRFSSGSLRSNLVTLPGSKTLPCSIGAGGIHWPFPADRGCEESERRLFEDGKFFHADGKAQFIWSETRPLPEMPDAHYPFLLLTGRGSAAQWHTQTRTGKSEVLKKLYPPDVYVELNPRDAGDLKIRSGDWVTVSSQRGSLQAKAVVGIRRRSKSSCPCTMPRLIS